MDQGLIPDTDSQGKANTFIGKFAHLIHKGPPALADEGNPSPTRPYHSFAGKEKGVHMGRGIDSQTIGANEREIRFSCQRYHAGLQVPSTDFSKPPGDNYRSTNSRLNAFGHDIGNHFGADRDHRQIDLSGDIRDAGIDCFPLKGTPPGIYGKHLGLKPKVVLVVDDVGRMPVIL